MSLGVKNDIPTVAAFEVINVLVNTKKTEQIRWHATPRSAQIVTVLNNDWKKRAVIVKQNPNYFIRITLKKSHAMQKRTKSSELQLHIRL